MATVAPALLDSREPTATQTSMTVPTACVTVSTHVNAEMRSTHTLVSVTPATRDNSVRLILMSVASTDVRMEPRAWTSGMTSGASVQLGLLVHFVRGTLTTATRICVCLMGHALMR